MANDTKKKERRPPETQTQYFCAVVQADYAAQMDVMRWLMQDRQYLCISALHDKDTYTAEDIDDKGVNDVYTRKNGDGTQSQFKAGDAKPAHYHLLIKTRAKLRPSALTKRFCGQVAFQACSDRYEYARYLTHDTFDSRAKYHYDVSALAFGGDSTQCLRWYTSMAVTDEDSILDVARRALAASRMPDGSGTSPREMLLNVLDSEDADLLRSMMAHSHFYDRFVLDSYPCRNEGVDK